MPGWVAPVYAPLAWQWSPAEVRRYALAVGAPYSVIDRRDLRLVTTNEPDVLPTFASLLADGHSLRNVPLRGLTFDPLDVIYAGHEVELTGPLRPTTAGTSTSRILDVGDVRSGVLVRRETVSRDGDDRVIARNVVTSVIRRASVGRTADVGVAVPEQLSGDIATLVVPTLDRQALFYAETGDHNPLHVDPEAARRAGFERPILHGLCAFGMVVHRVVRDLADQGWQGVRATGVRFTAPIVPGEEIIVRAARSGDIIRFESFVGDRRVQSHGHVDLESMH
ncbi:MULTISPECIES: MaoC/PaaZ C-terminal domain-containing protein [Microcella]|uniref:MaoC/PaaZ C-terminal domain-containing protein n=1 Tax=Microcella TaxID=337004 RepID=UPI0015CF3BE0|nr:MULTISPECIES: MaoC/PaaZ C-terminal domain-containing protein [Microcella]QOD94406.1 MaoC family dehydratase N-terminal domain-containing protein [Chryseoglobus sp. 28M-23]